MELQDTRITAARARGRQGRVAALRAMLRIAKETNRHRLPTTRKRKAGWHPEDEPPTESDAETITTSVVSEPQLLEKPDAPGQSLALKDKLMKELEEQLERPERDAGDGEVGAVVKGLESTLGTNEIIQRYLVGRSDNVMRKTIQVLLKRSVRSAKNVSMAQVHAALGYRLCREVEGVSRLLVTVVSKAFQMSVGSANLPDTTTVVSAAMVAKAQGACREVKDAAKAGSEKEWVKGMARI
ncbi:hypothetical protein Vafri_17693, partial [Volvox africanus]